MSESKDIVKSENLEVGSETLDLQPSKLSSIQVIQHGSDIHIFPITESEIEELLCGHSSISLVLFSLCVGVLISFLITVFTIQLEDRVFAVFIAIIVVSFLMGIWFGFRALQEWRKINKRAEEIKKSRGTYTTS